jgi:hypothetical protein
LTINQCLHESRAQVFGSQAAELIEGINAELARRF